MEPSVSSGSLIEYQGGQIFVPAGHFASKALFEGRQPEGHMHFAFSQYIKPGHTIIDIGANIGFHTIYMAKLAGPNGFVYAVEADANNIFCLNWSMCVNKIENVCVIATAASDETGLEGLLATDDNTNNVFSKRAHLRQSRVAVSNRIDDLIKTQVDFIKIDIEGAEYRAVQGLSDCINNFHPIIATEFSPYNILRNSGEDNARAYLNFFIEKNYRCIFIHPESRLIDLPDIPSIISCQKSAVEDLGWGHIDLLFVPEVKVF